MDLDPQPHVIMLTFGHENITQAVELGASYYILKPFNMETLAGRITERERRRCRPPSARHNNRERGCRKFLEEGHRFYWIGIPAHIKGYCCVKRSSWSSKY